MRSILVLLPLLAGCPKNAPTDSAASSPTTTTTPGTPSRVLLISAYTTGTMVRYDLDSGAVLGDFGEVRGAQAVATGPDGALYLVAEEVGQILRRENGQNTVFIADDPATAEDEIGGLANPTGLAWGADGLLYVGGFGSDSVVRFHASGTLVDVFASELPGLDGPDAGLAFAPDGTLAVPCFESDQVLFLDSSGAVVRTLSAGLSRPRHLAWEPDGTLWVSSWGNGALARFSADGTPLDPLPAEAPSGFVLDGDGVWVTSDQTDRLVRLDIATGTITDRVNKPALGLDGLTWLTWLDPAID